MTGRPARPTPRLLLLLAVLAACEVPALPDRSVVALRNTCADDGACGDGVCSAEGVCYAASASLGRIVLAVTPADDSASPTFIDRTIPEAPIAPARSLRLQTVLRGKPPVQLSLIGCTQSLTEFSVHCWNLEILNF